MYIAGIELYDQMKRGRVAATRSFTLWASDLEAWLNAKKRPKTLCLWTL